MHVVAMVALWSLVGAVVPECHTQCRLVNTSVSVEMEDGQFCKVETQGCEGLCHNKAPLYWSPVGKPRPAEVSCHFEDWIYEMKKCGSGQGQVPVLKALSCKCSTCDTNQYDCSVISPGQGCPPSGHLL
uniref:Follicle-stimulating hormone subunit beta n=1 Tax=Sardinops melanosticta TaxID=41697 RepID=A0A7G1HGD6_9TELE|nr:follicle-stimulating hormone subunit beta [Sardinops melanostictus]